MALEAKVWRVDGDRPEQLQPNRLDQEKRLEDWLCHDVGLLSDTLLVIGHQISISGGTLDVLAVDGEANLVVVELKRDKTPRDVVAQTLDYASCIQDFGREEVDRQTRKFLEMDFEKAFAEHFGYKVPETVNGRHRMYIVASSLDSATQRIVEYLSRVHGVDINAVTFSYFNTDQGEFVARSMLLDEDEVERRAEARTTERRRATKTLSARVEKGHLVVEFPEDNLKESWELPEPADKEGIKGIRGEAFTFARGHGARRGQVAAVGKALTDNGYHVRGPRVKKE